MPESLVACEGGIDMRSASINAPKGTLSNCYNFEKDQGPGYVRRLGWCRYDGRITGPEIEDAVVCQFLPGNLSGGPFLYGEQVTISSPGLPNLNAIVVCQIGIGLLGSLTLAYPIQDFTDWYDITSYPTNTVIVGNVSLASISSLQVPPCLMNDDTLSIQAYDSIKRAIHGMHSKSVLACPGRNESPLDAIFTYANGSYAIHDCVIYNFTNGKSAGVVSQQPITEGNKLRLNVGGASMGTVLSVNITSGSLDAGNAAGYVVVYDYPLGQAFPAVGARIDLLSATGALLVTSMMVFASAGDPNNTRAILYSTYEQYVKDYSFGGKYGQAGIFPPGFVTSAPPTWVRVPLTRELPYATVGVAADPNNNCFGPTGTNFYSQYEYTRTGLTSTLSANNPLSTGEQFPTTAIDLSASKWANPNNILVQDGATSDYNPISGSAGIVTAGLQGIGFNFSNIPDGSQILGIQFRFRAKCFTNGGYHASGINLIGSAFPQGISIHNKGGSQFPTTSLTDFTVGGPTDSWGEALNTTILKDPSFGVQMNFQKSNASANEVISVDAYAMTVFYAPVSRTVYIRDQTSGTTNRDVACNIIHYCIDNGNFQARNAVGVLTVVFATEASGTAAGKIRRLAPGNEIRTAPSSGTNVGGGVLLGFVTAEDYPTSFPPGAALDTINSRYEVIDANFWDVPSGRAAYIANGVEYATMFDGQYQVRIRTGQTVVNDCPRHLTSHLRYLHLGFASGAVVWTGTGRPLSTIGAVGAGGLNFAEPVTGMLTLNGQTLGVWTDRSTRGLQGTDPTGQDGTAGYVPTVISPAINCIEYSLVNLVGEAVWTSYRGVETIRSVQAYGDFETLPLSAPAQLWLQGRLQVDLRIGSIPSRAVYAIGVRNKRQYRLYFADGYVFTLTMFDAGDTPVCTIQRLSRPNATTAPAGVNDEPTNAGVIRHIYNGTRSDGKEIILASFENQNDTVVPAANGTTLIGPYFPYGVRIDCGMADDIQPYMPCFVEFNAIYAGYPTQKQQWDGGTIFINSYGGTQVTIYTKLDFDGPLSDMQGSNNKAIASNNDVRTQNVVLPVIEPKAFIPVPQRYMIFDIAGEGRMLKIRLDCAQTIALTNPVLCPIRITHLSLSTDGQELDGS